MGPKDGLAKVSTQMKITSLFTFILAASSSTMALDLTHSLWIWTNELTPGPSPPNTASPGTRPFRRVVMTPPDKIPLAASIIIVVDDMYTLFADGNQVGTGTDFTTAQGYCVSLSPFCYNVFALEATNGGTAPNPAGVLAAIEVTYTDGTNQTVVTDASWKTLDTSTIPGGFESFNFDDSSWSAATVEAPFGSSPWGATNTPPSPC